MFLSILLPIHNGYEFFDESLKSILDQTYTEYECLIGINGYPEGNKIYEEVKQKTENDLRFRVFNFIEGGAANTINKLIDLAKGDWIAHIDVDDKWHPEKLEYQVNFVENNDVDVLGTNTKYFGDLDFCPELRFGRIKVEDFLYMNPMIHSSVLVKRNIVRFNPNFVAYDYECWCKLFFIEKRVFYNLPIILTYHRIHEGSFFNGKGKQEPEKIRSLYSDFHVPE